MSGGGGRSGAARLTPIQSVAIQPASQPAVRPSVPVIPAPGAAPTRGRRPTWTLIAVAPTVSAGVRRFELRRWHVRAAMVGFVALTVLAFFAGMSLTRYRYAEQLDSAFGALTDADLTTAAMSDTLRALRIAASLPVAPTAGTPVGAGPMAAPAGRVVLPVDGRLTSRFARSRRHPILGIRRPHDGIDIAAPYGTPVHAPAAGRVVRIERSFGYGLVVEVNHGRGVHTFYAHLRSTRVTVGQRVTAGTVVATVGSSGLSSGPHLHYEVRANGRRVDPMGYRW